MNKLPHFNDIKPHCIGQWSNIFSSLVGPSVQPALDNRPNHAPCPVFGGKDSFHFYRDFDTSGGGYSNKAAQGFNDGFSLLAWMLDMTPLDALNLVAQHLRLVDQDGCLTDQNAKPVRLISQPQPEKPSEKNRSKLNELWTSAQEIVDGINDNQVLSYFRNRGLQLANMPNSINFNTIKFHQKHAYYEQVKDKNYPVKCHGNYPTLLAKVTDSLGYPVTIHRTYLSLDGQKADVPFPKKVMSGVIKGNTKGSSVKLFHPQGCSLGCAEGIETALASAQVSQLPIWSTLHTEGMKTLNVPEHVTHVYIFADKDQPCEAHPQGAGYEAALKLQERLKQEGKTVEIFLPPMNIPSDKNSVDWLDVLNELGPIAFPIINYKRNQTPSFLLEQCS